VHLDEEEAWTKDGRGKDFVTGPTYITVYIYLFVQFYLIQC